MTRDDAPVACTGCRCAFCEQKGQGNWPKDWMSRRYLIPITCKAIWQAFFWYLPVPDRGWQALRDIPSDDYRSHEVS